jgi:hypothetical protein
MGEIINFPGTHKTIKAFSPQAANDNQEKTISLEDWLNPKAANDDCIYHKALELLDENFPTNTAEVRELRETIELEIAKAYLRKHLPNSPSKDNTPVNIDIY